MTDRTVEGRRHGGSDPEVAVPIALVPETVAPVERCTIQSEGGRRIAVVARKPPGSGPFPAILAFHGGLEPLALDVLRSVILRGWTLNRLLSAGFLVALPARPSLPDGAEGTAIVDSLRILEWVRSRRDVARDSVALFGSSGGSDLALELAARSTPAAVIAEEPASTLFLGIFTHDTPKSGNEWTAADAWPPDPGDHFRGSRARSTRQRIRQITCPILLTRGDQPLPDGDQLRALNEVLIPELRSAGRRLRESVYPGQTHGFGFVAGVAPEPTTAETQTAAAKFFADIHAFLQAELGHLSRAMPI